MGKRSNCTENGCWFAMGLKSSARACFHAPRILPHHQHCHTQSGQCVAAIHKASFGGYMCAISTIAHQAGNLNFYCSRTPTTCEPWQAQEVPNQPGEYFTLAGRSLQSFAWFAVTPVWLGLLQSSVPLIHFCFALGMSLGFCKSYCRAALFSIRICFVKVFPLA